MMGPWSESISGETLTKDRPTAGRARLKHQVFGSVVRFSLIGRKPFQLCASHRFQAIQPIPHEPPEKGRLHTVIIMAKNATEPSERR